MRLKKYILLFLIFGLLVGNFCFAQELVPNDVFYSRQWYLDSLNMKNVWAQETGKNYVVMAIIDSGVDIGHPDLHDNIWTNTKEILGDNIDNDNNGYIDDINGWDFVSNSNDPTPKYDHNCLRNMTCIEDAIFHGTFIAGVASAIGNNNLGITGMSWQTKIMPLRILDSNGVGNTQDVVDAINYAVDNGADIINLSFVGDTFDQDLDKAVQRAYQSGLVIIAAAGNEDFEGHTLNLDLHKMYPICHSGQNGENIVIGVGSSDKNKKLAQFSNFGSSCIDIIAPGEEFWGALVFDPQVAEFNQYYGGEFSGTSLATPIVSGMVALIKSYRPELTNQQIIELILNNADNIDELNPQFAGKLGYGLINPVKIFQSLKIALSENKLIKGATGTIYYQAINNKRYVFPDTKTYFSWYDDFSGIKQVSDQELAQIPLAGNVTMRPGVRLVKIQTDPKVYAVAQSGVLRWIKTEDLAKLLYGANWAANVIDVSDAFFVNYKIGEVIDELADYSPFLTRENVTSIDADKGLIIGN